MRLEWLLNPLTAYTSAGLSLSLALFLGIKFEIAKARAAAPEPQGALEPEHAAALASLQVEVESLRESIRQLEAAPASRSAGVGINLTKRAQALRMHRRGEPISSIAAALETPGNEIALLLKVQALAGEAQKRAS